MEKTSCRATRWDILCRECGLVGRIMFDMAEEKQRHLASNSAFMGACAHEDRTGHKCGMMVRSVSESEGGDE